MKFTSRFRWCWWIRLSHQHECYKLQNLVSSNSKTFDYKWIIQETIKQMMSMTYIINQISTYLIQIKRKIQIIKGKPNLRWSWSSQPILIFLSPKSYSWFLHLRRTEIKELSKYLFFSTSLEIVKFKSFVLCKRRW